MPAEIGDRTRLRSAATGKRVEGTGAARCAHRGWTRCCSRPCPRRRGTLSSPVGSVSRHQSVEVAVSLLVLPHQPVGRHGAGRRIYPGSAERAPSCSSASRNSFGGSSWCPTSSDTVSPARGPSWRIALIVGLVIAAAPSWQGHGGYHQRPTPARATVRAPRWMAAGSRRPSTCTVGSPRISAQHHERQQRERGDLDSAGGAGAAAADLHQHVGDEQGHGSAWPMSMLLKPAVRSWIPWNIPITILPRVSTGPMVRGLSTRREGTRQRR
jgi:hypothetical protein